MKGYHLGEFEEIVLLYVTILHDEAYGLAITKGIEDDLNRSVTLSSVHTALYRMQDKGLVESKLGGSTGARGGRRKRLYAITNSGKEALWQARQARNKLWSLIPKTTFDGW